MASPRTITALSGAALASAIGVAADQDSTNRINRAVRRRIHPRRSPGLRSAAKVISYLAGPHTHTVVAGTLGILIRAKNRSGGFAPAAASLAALTVDNSTRLLVHQRRPPRAGKHHGINRYGYPSGHVTAATAISIAAAGEIAKDLSTEEKRLLWTAVAGFSLAVGWSRLYLDEHWIDDVVGGWMAGLAIGLGAASLTQRLSY